MMALVLNTILLTSEKPLKSRKGS